MSCPLCRQRKPRRQCPAVGDKICSVCCGTKRLTEIARPDSCPYLSASREHPPAAVKRQQVQDAAALLPSVQHLTERQYQLFFLFQTVVVQHVPSGLARLIDEDVAEAAGAVAATLETAARGVLYEHVPPSLTAQRLASELRAMLEEIRQQGVTVYDGEAAIALRAIEAGARGIRTAGGGSDTAYLTLVRRLLQLPRKDASADAPDPAPSLILP